MDFMYFLNQVVFTIIEAIFFLLAYCALSGKENYPIKNIGKSILFVLFYTIFTYWITEFLPTGIHTALIFIFTAICLSLVTRKNLYGSLYIMSAIFIFSFALEFAVMITAMLITGFKMDEVIEHQDVKLVCTVIVKLVEFSVIALIYKMNINKYFDYKVFKRETDLPFLVFIQAFLLGIIIISVNNVISKPEKIALYSILLLSVYLLFVVLVILDFKERNRLNSIKNKNILLQEHVQNIESIIGIIRREKHDFANHLNTIYGLCSINKPDMAERIKQYIKNIIGNTCNANKTVDTGNDYIDALIAVKNNYACEKRIIFKINIYDLLSYADINDKELVAVFSNIIDNAFDAVLSDPTNPEPTVIITTYIIENTFYISIKNNGPVIPEKYIKRIFTRGFSTKTINKEDHGVGLFIVKQEIENNDGTISVTSNERETEFMVKLGTKRKENEQNSNKAYKNDMSGIPANNRTTNA